MPSLPLASRKNLPGCPAIYFVLDGDRILYVGKTNNLWQRWITHHRFLQLSSMGDLISIAWLECEDISRLDALEKQLITALQPELNSKNLNENLRGKRGDPNYRLISGYVPKDLALLFKTICAATEIDQSKALEEMIAKWTREKQSILDEMKQENEKPA
ncbi:GIY-YIG nuclease family protein [Nostoc sp. CHAB 5844]|nr:GIY-YIG nuclease family protein [Nostoc sp. CHAB 5844]